MLIANMVVRNESDSYLSQVLTRLQDQVDLICITDDCSDDDTVELARSFEKVQLQIMSEPTFTTNEGKLRQASWEWLEQHVAEPNNTLVLAIDADEELYMTGPDLQYFSDIQQYDVFGVQFYHMWNESQYRVDGAWRPNTSTRCFRYFPGGRFRDRQLAPGSEPEYVQSLISQGRFIPNTGLVMKHLSYIKDEDKQQKYERYMAIDGGAFHASSHINSIIDPTEKVSLERWVW